jgi:hypothetical protein
MYAIEMNLRIYIEHWEPRNLETHSKIRSWEGQPDYKVLAAPGPHAIKQFGCIAVMS